ncbi:transposase family protein [Streptomyces sp. C10]|uniref:transposase family protein n=1 Tax=Streptomyces sp. C10 TaxID=531941 RepID=UPI003980E28A
MSAWRCTSLATEANPDPLYQAKHREHGMTVRALAPTERELVFLGKARAGSTHDLTAARADGIIESAAEQDADITADSGHQGADGTVHTPIKCPKGKEPQRLGEAGQHCPCTPASPPPPAERPFAQLKSWRVLHKIRISPGRVTPPCRTRSSPSTSNSAHSQGRR